MPQRSIKLAAAAAPMSGPRMGTQAYPQSELPFEGMGRRLWAMRGPRSRAGLMA